MTRHSIDNRTGVTLLEMTMVLAILMLLTGAIVVGEAMKRTSQLQQVVSEVNQYKQAIIDFRAKYYALPGDFAGATAIWGSADNVTPSDTTCQTTSGVGLNTKDITATCDGNGDGRITTQSTISTATQYEQFRAWQHLANAGLIGGYYTGVATNSSNPQQAKIGVNVPASALGGAGYAIISLTSAEATASTEYQTHYFIHYLNSDGGTNYMHMLLFGGQSLNSSDYSLVGSVLTPNEALALDSKIDDGLPGTGIVVAEQNGSPYNPNCTTTTLGSTSKYYVAMTGLQCSLSFLLGF